MFAKSIFSRRHNILQCGLILLLVLFFIDGPDYYASRHFKAFWNLGHILFFALLPYCAISCLKKRPVGFAVQGLLTFGACLVFGGLIELSQYGFQRTPDVGDLFRDVIGGMVGIFFLLPSRHNVRNGLLRSMQTVTACLVALQVYPLVAALADEYLARKQFPVLSSFETPWEIKRWHGSAGYAEDDSVHLDGSRSLRVLLRTDLYSGVSLFYFPENWEGAKFFRLSIYNPSAEILTLTCRINDRQHRQGGGAYDDRFNRSYVLPKGWHTIVVDMEDIREAPKGRRMDIKHVKEVGLFATRLPRPRVIFIDDVRLVY